MNRIICIAGPTASGKTALAVELAKSLNGEVVSCDSMQIYKRMDIGTAKPTIEEMQGIPHHMIDVVEPDEDFSVSRYCEMATPIVDDILARGKTAIIAGGTGLYMDSLIRGNSFAPFPTTGRRQELEALADSRGIEAVVELLPYLAGLTRNRVQCLDDFDIPLLLSHTVTSIEGKRRVEAVRIAQVDAQRRPIPETERTIPCDTLLLSVGLIPENELTRAAGIEMDAITNGPAVDQRMETSRPGIFACGNVVHVNDLVDNVTAESRTAGACAARYALGTLPRGQALGVVPGSGVRYVCPQRLDAAAGGKASLYFRVTAPGGKTILTARCGETVLVQRTVPRVSPGEMCRLDIDTAHLTAPVTVEAQEVEA